MRVSSRWQRGVAVVGLSVALGLAWAGSGFAQGGACRADVGKFCGAAKGGMQVARCLEEHNAELSPPCKERMGMLAQEMHGMAQACEGDVHTLCSGVQPGQGRIAACLKQNQEKVSAECKGKMADMKPKR